MKKLSFIALLMIFVLVFCACGKSGRSVSSETEPEASEVVSTEETTTPETKEKQTKETTTKATKETTTEETTQEETTPEATTQEETVPEETTQEEAAQEVQTEAAAADNGSNDSGSDSGSGGSPSAPASSGYSIDVNLTYGCVTVYYDGEPVRAMRCSVGTSGGCETVVGNFTVQGGSEWMYMEGNVWAQYATRFYGPYLFHSVPYYSQSNADLEYNDYNKLGSPASLGCVRLCVSDARWIYYTIPNGTPVHTFYDSSSPGPLGKPGGYWIPTDIVELRGWDPTDPAGGNPWPSYYVDITAPDITLNVGDAAGIFDQVSVRDCYGNDVSNYAEYSGSADKSTPGTYTAYVSVSIGGYYYTEKAFTVTVAGGSAEPDTEPAQTSEETPAEASAESSEETPAPAESSSESSESSEDTSGTSESN